MNTTSRAILMGVLIGIVGALGQIWLWWLNGVYMLPLRALLTLFLAAGIGTLAGLTGKKEALQAAGLTGFIAGALMSLVGLNFAIRGPALIGTHPFSSAETALSFISAVTGGTVLSSWIIAAIAVLVALPISKTYDQEGERDATSQTAS